MKRTSIGRCIVALACCLAYRLAEAEPPVDAAHALLATQRDAWNRADIDAFMRDYWHDEQLRFASGDTVRNGWQETIERYRRT